VVGVFQGQGGDDGCVGRAASDSAPACPTQGRVRPAG
jgi:hypothetical protein